MPTEDPLEKHFLETKLPIMEDVFRLPDRAAGIVAAAIIDDRLTVAIKSRLMPSPEIVEQLFGSRGRLGDFGVKIDVGLLLGLYDKGHRNALHAVREIRNTFAHAPGPVSFDMEPLGRFTSKLAFVRAFATWPKPLSPRNQFLIATQYLLGLMIAAAAGQPPKFKPASFSAFDQLLGASPDRPAPRSTPQVHRPNPLRKERRRRRRSSPE